MGKPLEPVVYCTYFHSNICHVCKSTENLKRCSKCKSVPYCSKDHQKLDWKIHKNFCGALSEANNECEFIAITNSDDFLTVKKMKYRLLRKYLKRELFNYENQIWMFPRFCEICYSCNVDTECDKCRSVFFCSKTHKQEFEEIHKKHCEAFTLNLQVGLFPIFHNVEGTDFAVSDISSHIHTLPNSLFELLELYDKNSTLGGDDFMARIRKQGCLSPIATILYGLEQSKLVVDRQAIKDELTIHVVGASMYEFGRLWRHMAELGFHWITNLKKLDFFVIGPTLQCDETSDKFSYQLCNTCKEKKCQTTYSFQPSLYHDIVNHIKKADAVVAFNSGLNGSETQHFLANDDNIPEYLWTNSIDYLVGHKNTPLILTDYTVKEVEKDIEAVEKYAKSKLKIVIPPSRNPFAECNPLRDFESQIEPFFYINGFVSVLTRI